MQKKKRPLIPYLLILFITLSIPAISENSSAAFKKGRPSIGKTFEGEELRYRLSFWWFDHAADGRITIRREGDYYLITLYAETTGFIGWVTRHRKDIYKAYVEEVADGGRFRVKTFEKVVNIGGRVRRGVTKMDYKKRIMTWKSWGGGGEEKRGKKRIPEGIFYDDPLTALYNFRYGAYGRIAEGKEYNITTFPKKGASKIHIRVDNHKERIRRIKYGANIAYLADIKVQKGLFGTQTGNIEAYFTDKLLPLGGIVKNIIFFGDVRGRLVNIISSKGDKRGFKNF